MSASSAYFAATIPDFLAASPREVLGALVAADPHEAIEATQRSAWEEEIDLLQSALPGLPGWIYLEFDVPRLGSRIDAVVVSGIQVMRTRAQERAPLAGRVKSTSCRWSSLC